MDRVHTTGSRTRAFLHDDGIVTAYLRTFSAFDTFFRVNVGTSVGPIQRHRILRTDFHAGMRQTTLAAVRHKHPLLRTGIARKLDHIDQRRRIIGFRLIRQFNVVRQRRMFTGASARQSHRQTEPFSYDRPLQKNVISKVSDFSRNNLVGKLLDPFSHITVCLVRHPGNLCKNRMADSLDSCLYSSHLSTSCFLIDLL